MILIERKIKGDVVSIGWYECVSKGSWHWTCFDANSDNEYEVHSQGRETSRADAISEVRSDYRNQST